MQSIINSFGRKKKNVIYTKHMLGKGGTPGYKKRFVIISHIIPVILPGLMLVDDTCFFVWLWERPREDGRQLD
jgi:hypothetical protein